MKSHLPKHLRDSPLIREGYRPNVAAVITNDEDRILWCERIDFPGSWQFPQGGIDVDETPESALWRELNEELGLETPQRHMRVSQALDAPIRYRYSVQSLENSVKNGRPSWLGQKQWYFKLAYSGSLDAITLKPPRGMKAEFSGVAWAGPERVKLAPAFKRAALEQALEKFGYRW